MITKKRGRHYKYYKYLTMLSNSDLSFNDGLFLKAFASECCAECLK